MSSRSPESRKQLNSSEVLARLRDLTVYLHRSNRLQAETTVSEVAEHLKSMLMEPVTADTKRAQQTFFAIDEVRMLLAQEDFDGAMTAARDAVREWKDHPMQGP